ncbi:hypothetical protein ACMFMG_000580 [Clarireedia jacksonii]
MSPEGSLDAPLCSCTSTAYFIPQKKATNLSYYIAAIDSKVAKGTSIDIKANGGTNLANDRKYWLRHGSIRKVWKFTQYDLWTKFSLVSEHLNTKTSTSFARHGTRIRACHQWCTRPSTFEPSLKLERT